MGGKICESMILFYYGNHCDWDGGEGMGDLARFKVGFN